MLEITIFRTQEKTKNLKRILLGQDNTFGPMGSGGYAVRIAPKRRNLLSFQELDTAPAKNFKVGPDHSFFHADLEIFRSGEKFQGRREKRNDLGRKNCLADQADPEKQPNHLHHLNQEIQNRR